MRRLIAALTLTLAACESPPLPLTTAEATTGPDSASGQMQTTIRLSGQQPRILVELVTVPTPSVGEATDQNGGAHARVCYRDVCDAARHFRLSITRVDEQEIEGDARIETVIGPVGGHFVAARSYYAVHLERGAEGSM